MQIIFWCSVGLIVYAYVGYPLLLFLLSLVRERPVKKGNITPTVSCIITVYNENEQIRGKIENTLKQDYPSDRLEIVVVSDCSTDGTDDVVKSYESKGIRLMRAVQRNGKEAAQKAAIDATSGEIVVFSDVGTSLDPNGISNIVKNFHDPTVGCVSSVDRYIDADRTSSGEGSYVKYEMALRSLETKVNSVVGLSGSFFAARRKVCTTWATDLQSDFTTLLNAVKAGLRGVSDLHSVGYYKRLADEKGEFERKVRTVLRGISVFMKSLPMLNPFRYSLFAWQLFSHKLCRWLVPFGMGLALSSNVFLVDHSDFYVGTLTVQVAVYAVAVAGIWLDFSRHDLLKMLVFLVMANWSILTAWYKYMRGERIVRWESSRRLT